MLVALLVTLVRLIQSIFNPDEKSNLFENVSSLIAVVGTGFMYFYNNDNFFFLKINKIIGRLFGKTSNWTMTYRVPSKDIKDFNVVNSVLESSFPQNTTVRKRELKDELSVIHIESAHGLESTIKLIWNDDFGITLKMECQAAQKDVVSQWNKFKSICEKSFRVISLCDDTKIQNYQSKAHYIVKIKISKNPFYLLLVRSYDTPKDVKYTLKFTIDDARIESSNGQMVISTKDPERVDKIIKDYVVISSVSDNTHNSAG